MGLSSGQLALALAGLLLSPLLGQCLAEHSTIPPPPPPPPAPDQLAAGADQVLAQLDAYLGAADFERRVRAHGEVRARFRKLYADKLEAGQPANKYLALLEALNLQLDLATNSFAARHFMVYSVTRLARDKYEPDAESPVRLARLKLTVERAKTRAKISAMIANRLGWRKLLSLLSAYRLFLAPEEVCLTLQVCPLEAPADEHSLSAEFSAQYAALDSFYQLSPGKSAYEIYKSIDFQLDEYFDCLDCQRLLVPKWTNAAPMRERDQVQRWRDLLIGAPLRDTIDKLIGETRKLVESALRLTRGEDMPPVEDDEVAKFQEQMRAELAKCDQ